MTATLYAPNQPARPITTDGLGLADFMKGYIQNSGMVAKLLDTTPELVDILASGPGYLVFSVFDHEGEVNSAAMRAVAALTGVEFDLDNEDEVLRGPVLVIQRH